MSIVVGDDRDADLALETQLGPIGWTGEVDAEGLVILRYDVIKEGYGKGEFSVRGCKGQLGGPVQYDKEKFEMTILEE